MGDRCSGCGFVPLPIPQLLSKPANKPAGRRTGLLPVSGRKAEMPRVKGGVVPSSMRNNRLRDHISGMKISRSASASRAVSEECECFHHRLRL